MKFKLKEDGAKDNELALIKALNQKFEELPDAATAEDIQKALNEKFQEMTGEKGQFRVLLDAQVKAITDDTIPGSLGAIVKSQGAQIAQLMQQGVGGERKESTLVEVLEELKEEFVHTTKTRTGSIVLELTFDRAAKKSNVRLEAGIKSLRTPGMQAKAAATQTVAGTITNSITTATGLRLGDGPIYEIKRGRPFILDFVNVGETNQAFLIWWDETAKQGDFAITPEGQLKPQVEYFFTRKSSDYRKSAGYIVLTDEFMNDMPQLVSTIRRLAEIDLMNNINGLILTDMIAALPAYTFSGLNGKIYHADDYAAIAAAITQIQSLFFQPTVLVLNPADSWKMKLTKDDVGRYQMPPFAFNGETFEFGSVITDPRVALDHFLVGDGTTFNVDFKGGVIIRIGYNGTDFIQNQQTLVIEQYFYDYIPTNRLGAWVYGNFSVIKGVINDTTNS